MINTIFGSIRAAIIKGGKILLVKESNEWVWETPGGRVHEEDKTPIETCKREVLEETGYECEVFELVDIMFHMGLNPPERVKKDIKGIDFSKTKVAHAIYRVKITKKVGEPEKDIVGVKWFSREEVKKFLDENKADDHDINVFKMFVDGKV